MDVAFAEWMRSHLAYRDTDLQVGVRGTHSDHYRVSIHARAYSSSWRLGNRIAIFALAVAAIIENTSWHTKTNRTSALIANGAGFVALVAFLIGYFGKKRTQRHAWVQCKDVERAVMRRDVEKLRAAVDDARSTPAAKWIASDVILVAGTAGFDLEALKAAKSYGIECFQQIGSGFERMRYGGP